MRMWDWLVTGSFFWVLMAPVFAFVDVTFAVYLHHSMWLPQMTFVSSPSVVTVLQGQESCFFHSESCTQCPPWGPSMEDAQELLWVNKNISPLFFHLERELLGLTICLVVLQKSPWRTNSSKWLSDLTTKLLDTRKHQNKSVKTGSARL